MRIGFPCYASSFACACTAQKAVARIYETAAHQHNNLKIIGACYGDSQKIILNASNGGYVYYNSFMPIVKVQMREVEGKTQVSILFELQKSTRILMILFFVLTLLFEMMLLVLLVMNRLTSFALLCFPLGLMILCYTLSAAGLYFSSKGVLRTMFIALANEDIKYIPPIHKSKYNELWRTTYTN